MAIFAVLVLGGTFMLLPFYGSVAFFTYAACLCLALVVVCRVKGEPTAWRGGRSGDDAQLHAQSRPPGGSP